MPNPEPSPEQRPRWAFDLSSEQFSPHEVALFEERLADFVPRRIFDAHCHLYRMRDLYPTEVDLPPDAGASVAAILKRMRLWMGRDREIEGLFFPALRVGMDEAAANRLIADEMNRYPQSRGLLLATPGAGREAVESLLEAPGISGFKTYHIFSPGGGDTFRRPTGDWTPEWVWKEADRRGWVIMLHLVLDHALAATENQRYLREHCERYSGAKVVLAHAGRGFNSRNTLDGIHAVRGTGNLWFDTSAITEPEAFEAILEHFGPGRLLYGSDFPISETRGRPVTLGEGFFWVYPHHIEKEWSLGSCVPCGLESLLALRSACERMSLSKRDIERIFRVSALEMLGMPVDGFWSDVREQYARAKKIIPGGTQLMSKRPEMFAPGAWPAYYEEAHGCGVVDTQGRRFVDMANNGILACILGFADPDVNAAVLRRVRMGSMCTQQTYDEVELAGLLTDLHPWAEQVRFTRGGGESMAVAVRIARAATGRDGIAVCGYHGWHDWYLSANLGSGAGLDAHLLLGLSPGGVPAGLEGTVGTFAYNDVEALERVVSAQGENLAAIVMEPARSVDPVPGFLEAVRSAADRCGAVLVFDEISIGWRMCLGGYHLVLGVEPDIAVFAKAMSNGFPMGAVAGRRSVMRAAEGSFISSTYWTEGTGPAAALATIRKLQRLDVPPHLARIGKAVADCWNETGARHGLPVSTSGRPQMLGLGFDHPQANAMLTFITREMLQHGFLAGGYFAPTWAHTDRHVRGYGAALDRVFASLAEVLRTERLAEAIGGAEKHTGFRRLAG